MAGFAGVVATWLQRRSRAVRRRGPLLRGAAPLRAHGGAAGEGGCKAAVVVGAGPSGLGAALMLARSGWIVTLLEQSADPCAFDPGRGFMYLIDGRGQRFLSAVSDRLLHELQRNAVEASKAKIGIFKPEGLKEMVLPLKDETRIAYWIPRHVFVRLLFEEARCCSRIQIVPGCTIEAINRDASGSFSVAGTSGNGALDVSGTLLVGADGIRSFVRGTLEQWDGGRGQFIPQEFDSPAAGLRYKVLTIPNDASVQTPNGEEELGSETMYSVRGAAKAGTQLKLGLLPVRAERSSRTANLISKPGDDVWNIEDMEDFLAYAERQWPHFPLRDLVPEEELKRFAADRGGRFPKPQRCAAAAWIGHASSGAVIIGDALHAFPPDLGQGVNSALEDVMCLHDALQATEAEGGDVASAVQRFNELRMPDVKALIDMMRVAAPYQYSQSKWGSRMWNLNFLARLSLNKILPKIFDLPAFLLVQQSELAYREVWRRAQRGAGRGALVLGAVALAVAGAVTKRLMI